MKDLKKTEAHKEIERLKERRRDIGKEMETLRGEIEELIAKKKQHQNEFEQASTASVEGFIDARSHEKKVRNIDRAIDKKSEELEQYIDEAQKFTKEIDRQKKKLYETYFQEAEAAKEKLLKLIEKASKINSELKEYEQENWDLLELSRSTMARSWFVNFKRIQSEIDLNAESWERMRKTVKRKYSDE